MAQGNIASDELVWLLTRKHVRPPVPAWSCNQQLAPPADDRDARAQNAYIHKRHGTGQIFSVERGNLTGRHSPKWSGLANRATLDISTPASGRGLNVSYRKPDASPYAVKSAIETKELKNGKEQAQKEVIQALETIGRPEVYQVRSRFFRCLGQVDG